MASTARVCVCVCARGHVKRGRREEEEISGREEGRVLLHMRNNRIETRQQVGKQARQQVRAAGRAAGGSLFTVKEGGMEPVRALSSRDNVSSLVSCGHTR